MADYKEYLKGIYTIQELAEYHGFVGDNKAKRQQVETYYRLKKLDNQECVASNNWKYDVKPRKSFDEFNWTKWWPLAVVEDHLGHHSKWQHLYWYDEYGYEIKAVGDVKVEDRIKDVEAAEWVRIYRREAEQPVAAEEEVMRILENTEGSKEFTRHDECVKITTRADGKQYEVKTQTIITIKRIENINEAYTEGGNLNMPRVNNDYLQQGLKELADRTGKKNIGLQLYYIISALVNKMSMNNFIKDAVSANWLDKQCPLVGKRFIDHEKPLQILIDEDIIAMNDKKQVMINPLFGIGIAPTENNLKKIQEMYYDFKSTGVCENHFNKNHPTEK